jgi:hypothetical protein
MNVEKMDYVIITREHSRVSKPEEPRTNSTDDRRNTNAYYSWDETAGKETVLTARYDARKKILHEPSETITLTPSCEFVSRLLSCVELPPEAGLPMTSSLVGHQNQTSYVGRACLRLRF